MANQVARIKVLTGEEYNHEGKISFVDTKIDAITNGIRVKAEFPNPANSLLPGEFATVKVSGTTLLNAISIPQKCILQTAQGQMVYVIDSENVANLRPVKTGQAIGQNFIVTEGLADGEIIVLEGINKIYPNQKVQPQPVQGQ